MLETGRQKKGSRCRDSQSQEASQPSQLRGYLLTESISLQVPEKTTVSEGLHKDLMFLQKNSLMFSQGIQFRQASQTGWNCPCQKIPT